jgi:ArsR family transcriptional regulator
MSAVDLALIASRLKALGDPIRLRIVATLAPGPRCVCEVQGALGSIAPNLLSYHLAVLRASGVVEAHRRGRWVDYSLNTEAVTGLCQVLARVSAPTGRAGPRLVANPTPTCAVDRIRGGDVGGAAVHALASRGDRR